MPFIFTIPFPEQYEIALSKDPSILNFFWTGQPTKEQLSQALAVIPESVTELNLGGMRLGALFNGAELAEIFEAIPTTVIKLRLGGTCLGRLSLIELERAFNGVHLTVTTLDLYNNDLFVRSKAEQESLLTILPAGLNALDISSNQLGVCAEKRPNLALVFATLSKRIHSFSVWGNDLRISYTGLELAQACTALTGVESLDLRYNKLDTVAELGLVFDAFPYCMATVLIDGNNLDKKTDDELIQLLSKVPVTVTRIIHDEESQMKINKMLENIRKIRTETLKYLKFSRGFPDGVDCIVIDYVIDSFFWSKKQTIIGDKSPTPIEERVEPLDPSVEKTFSLV